MNSLKSSTNWAAEGHIVGTEQFIINIDELQLELPEKKQIFFKSLLGNSDNCNLIMVEENFLIVETPQANIRAVWSIATGELVRYHITVA